MTPVAATTLELAAGADTDATTAALELAAGTEAAGAVYEEKAAVVGPARLLLGRAAVELVARAGTLKVEAGTVVEEEPQALPSLESLVRRSVKRTRDVFRVEGTDDGLPETSGAESAYVSSPVPMAAHPTDAVLSQYESSLALQALIRLLSRPDTTG